MELRDFFTEYYWNPHESEDALILKAKEKLLPKVALFSPGDITDIVDIVEKLRDATLARSFLDAWLSSAETRPEYQELNEVVFDNSFRKFHPEVLEKMNELRDKQHPPLTVTEAMERIVKNSGWGARERIAFQRSTVNDYEKILLEIKNDALRRFLKEHLDWVRNGAYGDESFKVGINNFIKAAANIYASKKNTRLSDILFNMFKSQGLEAKLESPDLGSK